MMEKTIIPNLDTLVSVYDKPSEESAPVGNEETSCGMDYEPDCLWRKFLDMLDRGKSESPQKTYKIDEDIIETIAQCDFKVPTTTVINCILRTFIVANIDSLRDKRQERPVSLFEKYPGIGHKTIES